MDIISFTRGVPPEESFPNQALIECARRIIRSDSARIFQYGSGAGYPPLREYIAEKMKVSINQVVTGQGSLQLLDFLCRLSIKEGDPVFIEQPTYDRTLTILRRAGADLTGFPLKGAQIDVAQVQAVIRKGLVPKLFYVIPDFQNPSGSVMDLETRRALVELAHEFGFLLIEDNPYRHLRYEGENLPALFELAPDVVIHMSSFSKMVSPGLRTGYMIPPIEIARDLIKFANDTYICPSSFDQALVVDFIRQGLLEAHIDYLIKLFRPRLKVLLRALAADMSGMASWTKPQGGYYVGLTLNDDVPPLDVKAAPDYGLALTDGRGFFLEGGERFFRLPFCALNEAQIKEGIRRFAQMAKS